MRVLVFAPIGRDAELTRELLERVAIANVVCDSIAGLCRAFEDEGGAALLMTEEALDAPGFASLVSALERQPSWSDVPILLFAGSSGAEMAARGMRALDLLRNVTLLERPVRVAAVLSAVRAALRGRARQYEVRDLLVQLRQSQADAESANRLKDEFLATLSHELRTPLNAILGWTSMLTRGEIEAARLPRVFEALDRNAQAQAQLIADVLDVSRIVTGKLQLQLTTVDMGDLVSHAADAVRPAATLKNIELAIDEERECLVRGDADRLRQVVWNLLSNAVKFTPAGGTVRATIAREGNRICLAVCDTGTGIAPQFLPYVFDRFRQADQSSTRTHGGLGLGLAIVKHLVELHAGSVAASSPGANEGACFRVYLPAEENAGAVAWRPVPADRRQGEHRIVRDRSILVVDDDASTREVLAVVLERTGARVDLASSAAEGWMLLQRRLPDLIIADLAMPVEDGFTFIRRVRQLSAAQRLPAIALSAYADGQSREAALAAGFSAFLAKPARPGVLLQLVSGLLKTA